MTSKIRLLVNGEARIQIQDCLTLEAMLFILYHMRGEINQIRRVHKNKNIQHALLVNAQQIAQMLSVLIGGLEHTRPEARLIPIRD